MENIITEYQKWKLQGESLRAQARQAMETRFRDLLLEAARIAQEYQADFGSSLKPPAGITTFRYKTVAKAKAKKPVKGKPPVPEAPPAKPDPKVAGIEKKLSTARKKLEAAKAAGTPTRNMEDRIYELEDDLRLATQSA